MGDERAETYLRLRAEAELRRGLRPSTTDITARVQEVRWAGEILLAAGVLEADAVTRIAAELEMALTIRSRTDPRRFARRLDWLLDQQQRSSPTQASQRRYYGPARPLRIAPIGVTLPIRDQRAPCDLHLMTLVRTPTGAAITGALRMHWPADGSSADLEITGAGIQHLPYEQLWAVDEQGTRYPLDFGGDSGTEAWHGLIVLSGAPPPGARWLDLIADRTRRLGRLDLGPHAAAVRPAQARIEETARVRPGERLLAAEAEWLMSKAWEPGRPPAEPRLGELTRVLADAGAIAACSETPGHFAALCQRLGVIGHGISAAPAGAIPACWASVLAQRDAVPAGPLQDVFAPLGTLLPDIEGTRFALAGLTSAAGESYLHVVASGLPERAGVSAYGWNTGFGWWLRDDAGGWHVAVGGDSGKRSLGEAVVYRLRLTPPLDACPDTLEMVVTGSAAQLHAVVPVRDGHGEKKRDT